jgi:hypothetical protein
MGSKCCCPLAEGWDLLTKTTPQGGGVDPKSLRSHGTPAGFPVHEEGLEPPHLAVPEPKAPGSEHDAASSGNDDGRDPREGTKVHDGPGERGGWPGAAGEPVGILCVELKTTVSSLRALAQAVLSALAAGDAARARAAASALAGLLDQVETNAGEDASR